MLLLDCQFVHLHACVLSCWQVGLVRAYGSRMERLDAEVLGDVQAAAAVWARAQNM